MANLSEADGKEINRGLGRVESSLQDLRDQVVTRQVADDKYLANLNKF